MEAPGVHRPAHRVHSLCLGARRIILEHTFETDSRHTNRRVVQNVAMCPSARFSPPGEVAAGSAVVLGLRHYGRGGELHADRLRDLRVVQCLLTGESMSAW